MLKRQLMRAERDTVSGYTGRVRALDIAFLDPRTFSLDPQSFADVFSMSDPLFPNIRMLHFHITDGTLPLIHHIAAPKLRRLHLLFFRGKYSTFVDSLGSSSPNVETT